MCNFATSKVIEKTSKKVENTTTTPFLIGLKTKLCLKPKVSKCSVSCIFSVFSYVLEQVSGVVPHVAVTIQF